MALQIKNLGTKENPVRCSGVRGIRMYLDALFDAAGLPIQYEKLETKLNLEVYLLQCSDGKKTEVYFDSTCAGYHESVLIEGFKTYKDFMEYKEYTYVNYYNSLLNAKGITEDHAAYFNLWKLCGTLLCFGPGFYASTDDYGMPIPVFNMSELNKACQLVVHTLAGIDEKQALPFVSGKYFNEFLATFHINLDELIEVTEDGKQNVLLAKCMYQHEEMPIDLWVELGEINKEKK